MSPSALFTIARLFTVAGLISLITVTPTVAQSNKESGSAKKYPPLEFRKWSGEINVPDPVSVSVDDQGRVYATQTRRRKIQDLDIREHVQWIPDDVALSSVEEKRNFLKQQLAVGGNQDKQRRNVRDINGDGQHDWRDLTVVSEAIYQLVDNDGDGTADHISVFAKDFKTEVTGIAAGVLAYDGDVWATIAPDVWKLTDNDGDGKADQRQVVAHGFGLHIAYAGHDMHGLTVGPDGKIYWSIGDKGINVTNKEGKKFFYPNQGGVLRCNPDGSEFEVFAHGLRNVQELAFDKYGNLFGVDNDADQPNEKERFVYIVNGMDAGWRCNYQYRNSNYNPWVDEKLWQLPGKDHPAYIVPPLSHYVDGPAGLVYNPGTALSPEYYDYFFLTSAPNGQQYAFRAEPKGDSFRMVDQHQIGSGIAIVGWNWGPDGALYGADWDGGYPLDQKGSVVRIDVEGDMELRAEVKELLANGFGHHSNEVLGKLLSHQDQRVRLYSQFELVKRNQLDLLQAIATNTSENTITRLHCIWGLGQLARSGSTQANQTLAALLKDDDFHVRGQAAKTYGESKSIDATQVVPLLNDEDDYVRTLAGIALARHTSADAVPALLKAASQLSADQHYLRHAFAWALSSCASAQQLAAESNGEANLMQRICCVIALRHQQADQVASYLNDSSQWVATEAARAIHDDFSIETALPDLAIALTERKTQSEAFARRAINANFRLGTPEAAHRVIDFAADTKQPEPLRLEAMNALRDWNNYAALDRIDGRNRHLSPRRLDPAEIADGINRLVGMDSQQLRSAALLAAKSLQVPLSNTMLVSLVEDDRLSDELRSAALQTLADRDSSDGLASVCSDVLSGAKSIVLRQHALVTLCKVEPAAGVVAAERLIRNEQNAIVLRQTAIRVLANLPGAESLLKELFDDFENARLNAALALDLIVTLQNDTRVKSPQNIDLRVLARDGGDAENGEVLFRTHQQAQCIRCHRVGRNGSDIGPELSKIGTKRDADYLLRAIIDPSADIDDKYRTQLFLMESGQLIKGVLISENGTETKIADSEGKEVVLANEEIMESKVQTASLMPEMKDVLTPSELRDLVAYLRSLKEGKK